MAKKRTTRTLPTIDPPPAPVPAASAVPAAPAGAPPEGYVYVHIHRNGRTAYLAWRMVGGFEQMHTLKTDATDWSDETMRDKAASYLGIPDDQAERVQLGQR